MNQDRLASFFKFFIVVEIVKLLFALDCDALTKF